MNEKESTEHAVAMTENAGMTATDQQFSKFDSLFGAGGAINNFASAGDDAVFLAASAMGGDAAAGGSKVGQEFQIAHWFVQPIQIVDDKTGEITDCPRVVLIDPEGNAIQFVSHGVYQSLRVILSYYGVGKLDPPIKVEIRQRRTRKSWNVLYLSPIK